MLVLAIIILLLNAKQGKMNTRYNVVFFTMNQPAVCNLCSALFSDYSEYTGAIFWSGLLTNYVIILFANV